jgi:hypothetical protein
MALDPNIALGVRPLQLEMPNPLAQYGQIAAIQNAQNQNQLAQYQLGSAQRAEATQNVLADAYSQSIDPDTGKINYNKLTGLLAKGGGGSQIPGIEKTRRETEAAALTVKKTEGEIAKNEYELRQKKYEKAWQSAGAAATPQIAIDQLTKAVRSGEIDMATATREIQNLQNMPPEQYREWRANKILSLMDAKDQYAATVPKVMSQFEAARLPIFQQQANIAQGQLGVSQSQLNLAQQKFAFEQANPTLSIQQTPTGYVAVNTTNGMAIPVLYGQAGFQAAGGAQPTATQGASMMRQPPAALPGQRTPVIPGMASVLDQTAAQAVAPTAVPTALPVGTPGTPVMGKQSELKPIPSNINLAILKNNQSIQQIDETIKLLQQNPSATGVKGYLPGFALNRMDPSGVEARAGVADIGSLVLHDRSGAAVTAAEAPRLVPFIPLPTDDNATVIKKLTRMRNIAAQEQTGLTETYGKDQGYAPNPTVGKTSGAPLSAQQIPPIYATNGKERIVSTDGGQTWTPANK